MNTPLSPETSALIARARSDDARERFSSFEEIAVFLNSTENKEKRISGNGDLLEDIAIVGAKNGVGTTHIAVALTCYLRSRGIKCAYRDCSGGHTILDMEQAGCLHERDFYGRDRLFLGELELGPGIKNDPKEYLLIKDYGTCPERVSGGRVLLIVGGRSWQINDCLGPALEFSGRTQCSIICNQGNRKTAGKYASVLHRAVYIFPTDADPMLPGRKKARFFRHLLGIRSLFHEK